MTRFRSGGDDNGSLLQKYILLQVEWDMYKHSLSNTRSTRRHPRAGSPAVAVPFSSAGLMAGLLDGSPKKLLSSLQGERDSSTTEVWRTGSVDWNSDEVVLKRKVVKTAGVGEQLRGRNLLEAIETAKDHDSASGETRKAGVPVKVASGLDAYVLDNLPSSFLWEGDLTATNGWKTEYVGWDPKEVSPMRTAENMAGVGEQLRGRNLLEAIETAKDHDSASGETRKAGVPVKVASELDAYGFDSSPSILWERDLTATNWWKTEYIGRDPKEVSPMRTVENMAGVGEQLKGRNLLDAMKSARDHDSGSGEKREPGVPVKVMDLTATNGQRTGCVGPDPDEVPLMWTAVSVAGIGDLQRVRSLLNAIEAPRGHDSGSGETRKAGVPVKVASERDAHVFDNSPPSFQGKRDLATTNGWRTGCVGWDLDEVSLMSTVENMAGVGEQQSIRNLLDAIKAARDHDSESGKTRKPGVPVNVSSDYAPDTPISRSSSCDFFPPADSNSSSTSSDVTTNKHASGHRGSSSSSVMGTRGKGERSMDTQAGVVSTRGAVHLREERGRRTVGMPWVNLALLIVVLVAAAAFWLVHPEEEDGSFIPT